MLLAIYPLLVLSTASAGLVCLVAAWRARRIRALLWFVFAGIVVTMFALTAENTLAILLRTGIISLTEAHSWKPEAAIKLVHVAGAGLMFWGAALALVELKDSTRRWVVATATALLVGSYALFVYLLW